MLAWCQVTWSSTWRARPWCSPRRPQQKAPPGCQPDTWDNINWIMNFRKKRQLENNRKIRQNNDDGQSMEFKIIWNFGPKSILLRLCSIIKIMLTQSSKSSEFNDQHIPVWMIVTLPFWPCPWTSRPPAGGRSCSPASCRARRTSAQCHKNTTWKRHCMVMTFTLIQGLNYSPANTREVWRGRKRWERWD